MGKEIVFKFIQEIASAIKPKSAKFLSKQAKDIEIFGEKEVFRVGVTDDMLQAFTPFRRLSKRTCSLSDPKYFIEQYEKSTKVLPPNWEKLTEAQKVDLIVKERYEQLVANKIMNSIKNEQVEHSFSLAADGEILSHDIGNDIRVDNVNGKKREDVLNMCKKFGLDIKGSEYTPHSDVHVHPHGIFSLPEDVKEFLQSKNIKVPKSYAPFSDGDLRKYCGWGEIGYVIDSSGNKFKFVPRNLGKTDYSIGETANRLFNEYEGNILNPLSEKVQTAFNEYQRLKEIKAGEETIDKAWEKVITAKTDFMTTMYNMQHRKEYLQSDEVKKWFGIFEELN